ncbi:hypothetical protein Nepgr_022837 [Nepenthes gracilis]|uniref:Uncharacterized protein n=1 Tax=Nepenthes gracilis TaxID=150966 RepID=A0AAD3T1F3_NEPGR|nr:hypothetical protein Nepgr_022837 [Nepenthes gracilis]
MGVAGLDAGNPFDAVDVLGGWFPSAILLLQVSCFFLLAGMGDLGGALLGAIVLDAVGVSSCLLRPELVYASSSYGYELELWLLIVSEFAVKTLECNDELLTCLLLMLVPAENADVFSCMLDILYPICLGCMDGGRQLDDEAG